MVLFEAFLIILSVISTWTSFYFFKKNKDLIVIEEGLKSQIKQKDKEFSRRVYELAILKELDDRIGYSLDVEKIVDIITGSLGQFIDYNVAAYMLIKGDELNFKVHVEKSVSRRFVKDVKDRMLTSLSTLLNRDLKSLEMEEFISGAILVDDIREPVKSFFNIPLVIGGQVVGVLTVAHMKDDMYHEEDMTILYKITNDASRAVSRLQEAVEVEQQKLDAMMASMSDGVVMTDLDYRIVVVNRAARIATGIPVDQKQVSIFDFIDKLSSKFDIRGRLEESVKLNKIIRIDDVEILGKHYQVTVLPVMRGNNDRKDTIGGVVIFHDISSEREAEKIREEFTSMLVHELRTPLDGVKKVIERVMSGKRLAKDKRDQYFDLAHESLSGMLDLVNEILDVAKFESGNFTLQKTPCDISKIIDERLLFFEQTAKSSKVSFVKNIEKNIPHQIKMDSERIGQVLNNIIGNALKFTGPGGTVSINAMAYKKGMEFKDVEENMKIKKLDRVEQEKFKFLPDSLLVSVSDSGIGIAEKDISSLFDKFSQVRNKSIKRGGSGLGLVISKNIIEAHGGIVGLSSKEGEGSTFYFSVPIDNEDK